MGLPINPHMFCVTQWSCRFLGVALVSVSLLGCVDTARHPSAANADSLLEKGIFFPSAPDLPRLQFLTSYSGSADLGTRTDSEASGFERFVLGAEAEVADGIAKPYGVAISEGKLYVCDVQKRAVEILDFKDKTFSYLSRERRMTNPVNICVVKGIKYVADPTAGQVFVFGKDNELKTVLGGDLGLQPIDVEVYGRRCYVTDMKSNQIVVLDIATGEVVLRVGKAGDELGQFVLIGDIALDEQENVYVTDKLLGRVTTFDKMGLFRKAFGKAGRSVHSFVRPKGIDVDRAGRIWVVDAAPEVAKVYNADGALLMFFGFPGVKPGNMNLPASILIDYEHVNLFSEYYAKEAEIEFLVFVTNQYGEKVNLYGFGRFPAQERAIEEARLAAVAEVALAAEAETPPVAEKTPQSGPSKDIEAQASTVPVHTPTEPTDARSSDSMQEIADLYYRSVHLYRIGRYRDARSGFIRVLASQKIPPLMAQTITNYLADIDRQLTGQ
jgi:hypothetical protein